MKHRKLFIVLGCVIVFSILIYVLSPIMISSSGIILGKRVDEFNNQYTLNDTPRYNKNKFSHLYMVSFHILTELEIKEVTTGQQPKVSKIFPFLYSVEQKENVASSIYEVSMGKNKYYFIYLSP